MIDDRFETGQITSRIGISATASLFDNNNDLITLIKDDDQSKPLNCILIDEAQFLTKEQVFDLSDVVDKLHIPVLAFGIRTDFQGELFEGSKALLAWSDKLIELKTVCYCGSKATMVIRPNAQGIPVKEGAQVEIGGNDRYLSVCRKHFKEAVRD